MKGQKCCRIIQGFPYQQKRRKMNTPPVFLQTARSLFWAIPAYVAIFIGIYVLPGAWVALLGFHLALGIALLPRLRTLPSRWFAPASPLLLLLMACLGLIGGVGLWIAWPYTGVDAHYHAQLAALGMTPNFPWLIFIPYFSLVNPLLEEAFWRETIASPASGPAPVDFLYAGFHLIILSRFVGPIWWLAAFVVLSAVGWLWRLVTRTSRSLLPAIVCHVLADFSIVWVVYQKAL